MIFFAARRFFSERTAWIAATLAALNPFLIFISAYLLTENLYMILLLGPLFAVPAKPELIGSWRRAVLMGLLLGLACLARPTAFFVALWIAGGAVLLGSGRFDKRLLLGGVLVATVLLTLVPWTIRNRAAFDKTMVFTSHGGITFYQGNNPAVLEYPQYHGGVAPLYMLPGYDDLKTLKEIPKDEKARELGRKFLRENPGDIPVLVWRKFARFWRFKSDVGLAGVKSGWWWSKESTLGKLASSLDIGFAYSVVVIPLFVIGLFLSLSSRRRWVFLIGLVALHTLVSLAFHGSLRMRIPIEPVIVMFAASAISDAAARLRRSCSD
jgi:4-amino-4-deoxy-L-arabinose transferase-like glycosyltransferase